MKGQGWGSEREGVAKEGGEREKERGRDRGRREEWRERVR